METDLRPRVCLPFVGDSVGGSHISAGQLIAALDRSRFEPVVVLHRDGPTAPYLRELGVGYRSLDLPALAGEGSQLAGIASAQVRSAGTLRRFLAKERIALVHTNDLRMHLTWSPATRLAGRRHVWHQRVLLSGSPLWRLIPYLTSQVVCPSEAVRATLPKSARARTAVIRDPVADPPAADFRGRLREELRLPSTAPVVGFVGNMMHQKRPHIFVEAAAHAIRAGETQTAFVLFGDDRGGELRSTQELVRTLGIEGNVHFAGYRRPIEPWLTALDLLLAPGVGDAFGRTLVEAMLAGVPVVAVASGGHLETIADGRTGYLTPPDDSAALAEAALRLLRDPTLRRRLAEAGRVAARDAFGADRHARQIESVYDAVLGMPVSRR